MDFRDFDAARQIVDAARKYINTLDVANRHPRPTSAIIGDLTDFLMHIYHHTLGGRTIACDLDFVEVRDGQIAALIELKKQGRTMSRTQELVTSTISKALDVPVYLLTANWDYTRFVVKKPNSRDELKLDRQEFHEFMQEFELPATRLDQI